MTEAVYGIDLGTTFSKCALVDPRTRVPIPFDLDAGGKALQSIVGLRRVSGKTVAYVGSKCIDELQTPDPELEEIKVFEEVKAWMGVLDSDQVGNPPPWPFEGWKYIPQDISALILRRIKKVVDIRNPTMPLLKTVISHPQKFTQKQRMATRQAGQIAGLDVITSISEPDAAALCYGANRTPGIYMVFDCGGGTLDVTIAKVTGENRPIEVITSEGLYKAGRDIDRCILDVLCEHYRASFPDFDRDSHLIGNTETVWLMKAREIKEKLSTRIDNEYKSAHGVEVQINNEVYSGGWCNVVVKNSTLEERTRRILDEFLDCAFRALDRANLKPKDLAQVLLVGGSSQLPIIHRMIEAAPPDGLGATVNTDLDPTTAISIGAAKFAVQYQGSKDLGEFEKRRADMDQETSPSRAKLTLDTLKPVLPNGVGIIIDRDGRDVLHVMIPKDTTLPFQKKQSFRTITAGATSIPVELWEGNEEDTSDGEKLGLCELKGIPEGRPAGQRVEVCINVAHNAEMKIEVVDAATGKREEMSIQYDNKSVVGSDDIAPRRDHILGIRIA